MGGDCDLYGNKGDGWSYRSGNDYDEPTKDELKKPEADWWGDLKKQPTFKLDPVPSEDVTKAEVVALRKLQELREAMMKEINKEDAGFTMVFERALGVDAVQPSKKDELRTFMHSLDSVTKFWVCRLKDKYDRARPVAHDKDLRPPFCPGHPAYPAAHAATAHLFALALIEVTAAHAKYHQGLRDSAKSVSYHREVAGVHFHSDICAGEQVAQQLYAALKADSRWKWKVDLVRAELEPFLEGKDPPRVLQRVHLPSGAFATCP